MEVRLLVEERRRLLVEEQRRYPVLKVRLLRAPRSELQLLRARHLAVSVAVWTRVLVVWTVVCCAAPWVAWPAV